MDELTTKQSQGAKKYLLGAVIPVLVEGMAVMSVERPEEPLYWLGKYIIEHSEAREHVDIIDHRPTDINDHPTDEP